MQLRDFSVSLVLVGLVASAAFADEGPVLKGLKCQSQWTSKERAKEECERALLEVNPSPIGSLTGGGFIGVAVSLEDRGNFIVAAPSASVSGGIKIPLTTPKLDLVGNSATTFALPKRSTFQSHLLLTGSLALSNLSAWGEYRDGESTVKVSGSVGEAQLIGGYVGYSMGLVWWGESMADKSEFSFVLGLYVGWLRGNETIGDAVLAAAMPSLQISL